MGSSQVQQPTREGGLPASPVATRAPVPAPTRTPPAVARLQAGAGNQAVLRLLRARDARPVEHLEHQADQIGRDARSAAPTPLVDATGSTLSAASRAFFEPRVGHPLAAVRIHRDASAHRAAAALDARAFTSGADIFLGRGESAHDAALIGHELAHVGQQARGGAPPLQCQNRPPRSAATPAARAVLAPAAMITNEALREQLIREHTWLATHPATDPDYVAHRIGLDTLEGERQVRVQLGALWMEDPAASARLYKLVGSGEAVAIVEDFESRTTTGERESAQVVSEQQLQRLVNGLGIRVFPPAAGAVGGTLTTGFSTAGDYGPYARIFAQPTNTETLETRFPGNLGEYAYNSRAPGAATRVDLNTRTWQGPTPADVNTLQSRTGSHPVFDFLEGNSALTSVKMSPDASQATRFRTYNSGVSDIMGGNVNAQGVSTLDQAVFNLEPPGSLRWPPNSPALTSAERAAWQAARLRTIGRARLAINTEDVGSYRTNLAARMVRGQSGPYRILFNAFLAQQPEVHNGITYNTLADINAAPTAVRRAVKASVAQRIVASLAVDSHVTGAGARGLMSARTGMVLDAPGQGSAPRPQVQARSFPEMLAVAEQGYRGPMVRAAGPGAMAGGAGGLLATPIVTLVREGRLPTGGELATGGVGGAVGGAMGAPAEVATQAWIARTALARLLTSGSSSASRTAGASMVRGLGGGIAAGPIAGISAMGIMGFNDLVDPLYNPAALDYYSGGGRGLIVGGVSGFATSALTFAIFGAALGPLGFVVGLFIGVGLYILTDYLIGARTERMFRSYGAPMLGPAVYPVVE